MAERGPVRLSLGARPALVSGPVRLIVGWAAQPGPESADLRTGVLPRGQFRLHGSREAIEMSINDLAGPPGAGLAEK